MVWGQGRSVQTKVLETRLRYELALLCSLLYTRLELGLGANRWLDSVRSLRVQARPVLAISDLTVGVFT